MALAGNWDKVERYQRLGQLGGYQCKDGVLGPWRRGMPKLTQAQQAQIVALYQKGELQVKSIATLYGVTAGYVSKLVARRGLTLRTSEESRRNKSEAARNRRRR
jgi:transposase-like protein